MIELKPDNKNKDRLSSSEEEPLNLSMISMTASLTTMEDTITIRDIRKVIIRAIIIIKVDITINMDTKILIKAEEGFIKVNIQEISAEAKINMEIRKEIKRKMLITTIKIMIRLTK